MKTLKNTMVLWDDDTGDVVLRAWPERDDSRYRHYSSWGACDFYIQDLDLEQRKALLFIQFAHWVIRDGLDPQKLSTVLMQLEEWRAGCASDMPGVAQAMRQHGEVGPAAWA